jgi:hypothetical protein
MALSLAKGVVEINQAGEMHSRENPSIKIKSDIHFFQTLVAVRYSARPIHAMKPSMGTRSQFCFVKIQISPKVVRSVITAHFPAEDRNGFASVSLTCVVRLSSAGALLASSDSVLSVALLHPIWVSLMTASVREVTASLEYIELKWASMVRFETPRVWAISLLLFPWSSKATTSISRLLNIGSGYCSMSSCYARTTLLNINTWLKFTPS